MKLLTKIRIEIFIILSIMFILAFVPQSFESIFYYTSKDCGGFCKGTPHLHWTSQHYVWTFGGVVLSLIQVIWIIVRLDKSTKS